MRILVVAPQPFYTERGTPIAVRQLVQELAAIGHSVDLLTYPFGEDVCIEGVTVYRCSRFPGVRSVPIGFSFRKVLMDVMLSASPFRRAVRGRYTVVHAVEEAVLPAAALRWRHRGRVVYDMDSHLTEQLVAGRRAWLWPLRRLVQAIENRAIAGSDAVIAVNENLADVARRVSGTHKVYVLPDTPLPDDDSATAVAVDDLRSVSGASGALALYVGNLETYQGIDLLLDACARLPVSCDLTVVAVGGGPEAVARYARSAKARGLESRVRFIGARPVAQLNRLLGQADILLSPRISGHNTPMKVYSYMNSGRPILATRLNTHTQVLDDATALLCAPEPDAFAQGMLSLARDPALRQRLGSAARGRVVERYSPAVYRRKLQELYASELDQAVVAGHSS